jgi:hypothetical protein
MAGTALVTCGALAREVLFLKKKHGWDVDVLALPSLLHNEPERIPAAVRRRIRQARQEHSRVIVVYADCGTGGLLDRVLQEEDVERLPGPHCYALYADGTFDQLMDEAPGTYFLTDYLLQSFDHLVLEGLGLDRFPELRKVYFANYTRVVYLAQRDDPDLRRRARWAADSLGLPLEIRQTGYGNLETRLKELIEPNEKQSAISQQSSVTR